ncbi:MlaD family protein [Patulibacter defluvii]|uniref:MlaD family protein n=1 Tax=Patulibacter defluvii TaxID=3095358 RepID=UPI002A749CA3|nr:MlaD family protein [Patulibacter sp. DM4]
MKSPSPYARAALIVVLALVVVALGVILLGGGSGSHRYSAVLPNAGQLVNGDEVRVGGRRVGTISDIRLTADDRAQIDLEVSDDVGPVHEGTTVTVRAPSLSGIANRFVSLDLGPNNAPTLKDGATIPADRVDQIVDLDQLFATFDAPTRKGIQRLLRGGARSLRGKEQQANEALRLLNPSFGAGQRLIAEVTRDQPALQRFLSSSADVVTALAADKASLTGLVDHARSTSSEIVAEEQALNAALDRLPGTLRKGNTTFVNLRRTLDDLDPLVAASKPATRRLTPLLRDLRPLVASARPTIADLRRLVRRGGADNDLIDLLRKTPRLADVGVPALDHSVRAAADTRPVAAFIRPYTPDAIGWLRDFSQGSAGYDANGHYARIQPIINENAVVADPLLGPIVRQLVAGLGGAGIGSENVGAARCPGTATQIRPDGSNGFRDSDGKLDCDPKAVLPGP